MLALVLAIGCGGGEAASTSILRANGAIWLTSPDDDTVVAVDPRSLEVTRTLSVEGGPEHLARADGQLVVTLGRRAAIAFIRGTSITYLDVPCGGTQGVVSDGEVAWITCPNDDTVLAVDVKKRRVMRTTQVRGGPHAIAMNGRELVVTAPRRGMHVVLRRKDLSVRDTEPLPAGKGRSAVQAHALAVDGGVIGSYQLVEHANRNRPADEGGYGSVIDGNPRISPRLVGDCGATYARYDGGARVFSGPIALGYADRRLWVVNQYTDNVAVLDCDGSDEAPLLASFRVGRGPRGIHVEGDTAWVDVGFDHAVAKLDLSDGRGQIRDPSDERLRPLGPSHLSADARRGRSLFHDAVDIHLTPSGIVTCATCHPGGNDDGLSWFLHTENVPRKVRRTPPAWGARADLMPLHWDGEFTDGSVLSATTIRELMEGDGLLVDTDAMASWMAELPPPPPPALDHDAQTRADNGRRIAARAGCVDCHNGELYASDGLFRVVPPMGDADADLGRVSVPPLVGVRARGPWLHDGRAESLRAVLTVHNVDDEHGRTNELSPSEIDDLVHWLRSL